MAKKTSSMERSKLAMLEALNAAEKVCVETLKKREKKNGPEAIGAEWKSSLINRELYIGNNYLGELVDQCKSPRDEMAKILDEKYEIEKEKTELLLRIGVLEENDKAMDSVKRELEGKSNLIAELSYEEAELEKACKEQESEIEGLVEKVTRLAKANIEAKHHAAAAKVISEDRIRMLTWRTSDLINDKLERVQLKIARLKSRVAEMEVRVKEAAAEKLLETKVESGKEAGDGVIVRKLEEQLEAMKICCRDKEAKVEELSQQVVTLEKSVAEAEGFWSLQVVLVMVAFAVVLLCLWC